MIDVAAIEWKNKCHFSANVYSQSQNPFKVKSYSTTYFLTCLSPCLARCLGFCFNASFEFGMFSYDSVLSTRTTSSSFTSNVSGCLLRKSVKSARYFPRQKQGKAQKQGDLRWRSRQFTREIFYLAICDLYLWSSSFAIETRLPRRYPRSLCTKKNSCFLIIITVAFAWIQMYEIIFDRKLLWILCQTRSQILIFMWRDRGSSHIFRECVNKIWR